MSIVANQIVLIILKLTTVSRIIQFKEILYLHVIQEDDNIDINLIAPFVFLLYL